MKKINKISSIATIGDMGLAAIAGMDHYYSDSLGFSPIRVHEEEKNRIYYISLKQIAKPYCSEQSEFLERDQIKKTLDVIGYESRIIDSVSESTFKKEIQKNISQNSPSIIFFAAEQSGEFSGIPTVYDGSNECAALIIGFNKETDEIIISHGAIEYVTPLSVLFHSSCSLPKSRKNSDKEMKFQQEEKDGAKLITIKKPTLDNIYDKRKSTFPPLMEKTIEERLHKVANLIKEEKVKNEFLAATPTYLEYLSHFIINGNLFELGMNIIEAEKIITFPLTSISSKATQKIVTKNIRNISIRIFHSLLNSDPGKDTQFDSKESNFNIFHVKSLVEFKSEKSQKFLLPSYEIYIDSKTTIPDEIKDLTGLIDTRFSINLTLSGITADFFQPMVLPLSNIIFNKNTTIHFINMEGEFEKIKAIILKIQTILMQETKPSTSQAEDNKIQTIPADPEIHSSQSVFSSRYQSIFPDECKDYEKKHSGLCQPLSLLIAKLGIHHLEIKQLLEFGNLEYAPDKITNSAVISKLNTLCSQVMMISGDFQAEIKKNNNYLSVLPKDEKNLVLEYQGIRKVNVRIMKLVFDEIKEEQFLQVSVIKNDEVIHATLIFKMIENDKILYCFYEPNFGVYKKPTVEALCDAISTTLTDQTTLSIVDVNQFDYLLKIKEYEIRVEKLKEILTEHLKSRESLFYYIFSSKSETIAIQKMLRRLSGGNSPLLSSQEFDTLFSEPLASKLALYRDIIGKVSINHDYAYLAFQ